MSDTTTRGIRVQVESLYVPERSEPEASGYFFAYRVHITNVGTVRTRLETRHWVITDGDGGVEEVRGPGVVGAYPDLEPGEAFSYTSACPLSTPVGTMQGSFQMVTEDGTHFDAVVTPFRLAMPTMLH